MLCKGEVTDVLHLAAIQSKYVCLTDVRLFMQ